VRFFPELEHNFAGICGGGVPSQPIEITWRKLRRGRCLRAFSAVPCGVFRAACETMRNRPLQITGMPPKNPAAAAGTGVAPLIARSVAENRNVFF